MEKLKNITNILDKYSVYNLSETVWDYYNTQDTLWYLEKIFSSPTVVFPDWENGFQWICTTNINIIMAISHLLEHWAAVRVDTDANSLDAGTFWNKPHAFGIYLVKNENWTYEYSTVDSTPRVATKSWANDTHKNPDFIAQNSVPNSKYNYQDKKYTQGETYNRTTTEMDTVITEEDKEHMMLLANRIDYFDNVEFKSDEEKRSLC